MDEREKIGLMDQQLSRLHAMLNASLDRYEQDPTEDEASNMKLIQQEIKAVVGDIEATLFPKGVPNER